VDMNIEVSTKERMTVVAVKGTLDADGVSQLEDHLIQLFNRGDKAITIEMSRVPYICSAGLRVLLLAQKQLASRRGSFCLVGVTKQVSDVFQVTGLSNIFTFYASLDEACAAG
jgi:anti-sigma B factor antagonist